MGFGPVGAAGRRAGAVNALVLTSRRSSKAGKAGCVPLPDRKQSSGSLKLAVEAGERGSGEVGPV